MQIEIKDLSKIYMQGDNEVIAVDDVSMSIDKGEIIAITGQSGSGKTTLLNMIGGIETPSAGRIMIDGVDIANANDTVIAKMRRTKMGYVFQDYNLLPILTVEENISMPIWLDSKEVDGERLKEILKFLEIENRRNHLPNELSGGQKQRVALARAMMIDPQIILADEPTGNLDQKKADEIMSYLLKLRDSGVTIILVTHELRYADMCDRKYVLCDGKIVE